jgi:hypothetical protein
MGRIACNCRRSAISFSASPTANPVGARKRRESVVPRGDVSCCALRVCGQGGGDDGSAGCGNGSGRGDRAVRHPSRTQSSFNPQRIGVLMAPKIRLRMRVSVAIFIAILAALTATVPALAGGGTRKARHHTRTRKSRHTRPTSKARHHSGARNSRHPRLTSKARHHSRTRRSRHHRPRGKTHHHGNGSPTPPSGRAPTGSNPSGSNPSGSNPPGSVSPPPPPAGGSPSPNGVPGNWKLVFDDEFNGTSLDTSQWDSSWFNGGTMNNVATSPSNVSVANGVVNLTLSNSTTGALIHTTQAAGRATLAVGDVVEGRIWFPGNGTQVYNWPAFWANDTNHYPAGGENDIAEVLGGQLTVNYHSPSGAHNQGAVPGYWGDAWHTYALYRQAGHCDVYWDGHLVKSYSTDDDGAPEDIMLNIGAGEGPTMTGPAGAVKVDYVRLWAPA